MRTILAFWLLGILVIEAWGQPQAPDTLWTRSFPLPANDQIDARSVLRVEDGALLVAGEYYADEVTHLYVSKISGLGDSLWLHRYGSYELSGGFVCAAMDDGYFLGGSGPSGPLRSQFYIARFSMSDSLIWERTYGTHNSDDLQCIAPSSDGGVLLGGCAGVPILLKVSGQGDSLWMRSYAELAGGCFESVVQLPEGNIMATGEMRMGDSYQFVVARLDPMGVLLAFNSYGGAARESGNGLTIFPNESVLAIGQTESYTGSVWDTYLVKENAGGDSLWTAVCGNGGYSVGLQAIGHPDGSATILSAEGDTTGIWGPGLARVDSNGLLLWHCHYHTTDSWCPWMAFTEDGEGGYLIASTDNTRALVIVRTSSELFAQSRSVVIPTDIGVTVYPNPSNGWPRIELSPEWFVRGAVKISVYDVLGRRVGDEIVVFSQTGTACRAPTTELATGVYFVRVQNVEHVALRKVMVLK
jgi:hypothetical protein